MTEQSVHHQHHSNGSGSLQEELKSATKGRRSAYTEEQRAERAKLAAKAQTLALSVLKARHNDEYQELYGQAKREVGLD